MNEEDEDLKEFVKQYPRAGYDTYKARMMQEKKKIHNKSYFIYHKPVILQEAGIPYKQKAYTQKKEASNSKNFFDILYRTYGLIINLDGKSMEDIPNVQRNFQIRQQAKWISQAVEIQSGAIWKIGIERSHNKTNAGIIIKEIVSMAKDVLGKESKVLFLTDAGSEYLNHKDLRGTIVPHRDTSKIVKYLQEEGCDLMITRFKQDNGYIENKNKYIEIAYLDNKSIKNMNLENFHEGLQSYMDMNNYYLHGSNKYVYRGYNITPRENLISRFGGPKADKLLSNLSASCAESKHRLKYPYGNLTLYHLVQTVYPYLSLSQINSLFLAFPKSLDSSKL